MALAGTLKAGAWIDRDGNARPSLDLVAAQVMTVYGLAKKRKASTEPGNAQHAPDQHGANGERDLRPTHGALQRHRCHFPREHAS